MTSIGGAVFVTGCKRPTADIHTLSLQNMSRPVADIANRKWVIASDVRNRDGIGIELYVDETLVLEIFRDDAKMTREVNLHKQEVSLELLEEAIATFKEQIPQDFLD